MVCKSEQKLSEFIGTDTGSVDNCWPGLSGESICYPDQVNLSVTAPYAQEDPRLDSFHLKLMLSGFYWTYAIFRLVGTYLVDRFEARLMYAAAISGGLGVVSPTLPDASFRLKVAQGGQESARGAGGSGEGGRL